MEEKMDSFILLRSSAGSGKTYNLALRYIKLLLSGVDPSNIVAITFTNKAAMEMRERLFELMKTIILDLPPRENPLEEKVFEKREKKEKARKIIERSFEKIIRHYYDFKVGTIDSLVAHILKASAFRLNLHPDFEIKESFDTYKDYILHELLQSIIYDERIKAVFDRFIENYLEIEQEGTWYPKFLISETISFFWKEETKESKEFELETKPDLLAIKEEIFSLSDLLKSKLKDRPSIKLKESFFKALQKNIIERIDYGKKFSDFLKKESERPDECILKIFEDIKSKIRFYYESLSLSKFLPYLELYSLFKDEFRKEVFRRFNAVLIDQLNQLLFQLTKEKDFVPEIYYTLSERYLHFLIDEFQDTNHLQWRNIEVFIEEALSKGGSLFIVGDTKQAIYRFRGGKAELLEEVFERYKRYLPKERILSHNYRSNKEIVNFNNILFDPANLSRLSELLFGERLSCGRLREFYRASYQSSQKDGGFVFVETCEEEKIIERLREILFEIRNNNIFRDGEIAILVRKNLEVLKVVEALLEMGLRVDSDVTINLFYNGRIKETINFFRFLQRPYDNLSFAGFLKGKIFETVTGIEKEKVFEWILQRDFGEKTPLYLAFREEFKDLWETYFDELFKKISFLPLYDLLLLFIKNWNIFELFKEDIPFFLHLLEMAKEMEDAGEQNLESFLQLFEEREMEKREDLYLLKTSKIEDAIKVMTIHKAKGLQFPCVIVPFARLSLSNQGRERVRFIVPSFEKLRLFHIKKDYKKYSPLLREIYERKEEESFIEELNVLYVAFTRPMEALIILLPEGKKNRLIDYLFDLEGLSPYIKEKRISIGELKRKMQRVSKEDQKGLDLELKRIDLLKRVEKKIERPKDFLKSHLLPKRKGEAIHFILSLIKGVEREEELSKMLYGSIERAVRRYNLYDSKEEIERVLGEFFGDERIKKFFIVKKENPVYTEKEIVDRNGNTFKVDRLIKRETHIELLEFKTGETKKDEHISQVTNYKGLLSEIEKDPIKAYLIYVENKEVIEI